MRDGSASGPGTAGAALGVDVGGTFTDVFVVDEAGGSARALKVPTTRPDQSEGFIAGVEGAAGSPSEAAVVVHGTTAGTNALLERRGARVGVITTEGFRDALEMRRRDRPRTWGLRGDFEPVVPRALRLEVPERTLADGAIRTPVDLPAVREAAARLREAGCEAVAVLFVNAHVNATNERAAVAAVSEVWPEVPVAGSSDIDPQIREFERFSTTALNAYLQPELSRYLGRLRGALRQGGFGGEFLVVGSNGGVMPAEAAARMPARTALSGPAAGVIAAARIAEAAGFPDVVTGDVGGTSFDVSLIVGGRAATAPQTSVGFGLVIRLPMVEITTIGAGGGSIAAVDRGGLLQVGPRSAGSDPGPAAHGRGGVEPTVTDAHVLLGRIDPERPIAGGRLDVEAARAAIARGVGEPLGLDLLAAADAILRVANARMAGAIRLVSVERGHDPRRFALMPFGGGGALHAGALLAEAGIARALIPRFPGVTSAMGCVLADLRQDFVRTIGAMADETEGARLAAVVDEHASEGRAALRASGARFEAVEVGVELDMAYAGQTHTVAVPLDVAFEGRSARPPTRAEVAGAFDAAYRAAYGRVLPVPRRILNLRTTVIGRRPPFDLAALAPPLDATLAAARRGTRAVWFGGDWREAALFDRLALPVGVVIAGPAVLDQPDTTVVIEPGLAGRVDRLGNVVLEHTP